MDKILIQVKNLKKYYPIEHGMLRKTAGFVKAVDGVSFDIKENEVLGIVGESGCGKTTLGKLLLDLIPPTGGEVIFEDEDIFKMPRQKLKDIRKNFQIVFQDPFNSLDPKFRVIDTVTEPLLVHRIGNFQQRKEKAKKLFRQVGLDQQQLYRYPNQFSGGQRQRIGIARALATSPKFIVCDEPVSSLDRTIQTKIINLLLDLKREFNLTLLFITHDLGVVKKLCDRVMVMYYGKIVEIAETQELFNNPRHPYTKKLLSALPFYRH